MVRTITTYRKSGRLFILRGIEILQQLGWFLVAKDAKTRDHSRLTDRGEIRPGMRADLVMVAGDPTTDIRATRKIISVWKRGVLVPRRALAQNAFAQPLND